MEMLQGLLSCVSKQKMSQNDTLMETWKAQRRQEKQWYCCCINPCRNVQDQCRATHPCWRLQEMD